MLNIRRFGLGWSDPRASSVSGGLAYSETDVGLVSGGLSTKLRRSRVVSVMSRPTVGWSGHQKPDQRTFRHYIM